MKKITTLVIVMFLLSGFAQAETALEIIKASGVKGGLIVCVGAENPDFVVGLHADDKYLVHCLDVDQKKVAAARKYIQTKGLYGKVSVDVFDGKNLPYADNLVNLIVVNSAIRNPSKRDKSATCPATAGSELERVLAPRGVAMARKGSGLDFTGGDGAESKRPDPEEGLDGWSIFTKPWPPSIDDWTHYLHGPDGNMVAKDSRVGPPKYLQWKAGPQFSRDHDALASISAMVSSKGRMFYIIDEGSTSMIHHPPEWKLVARDAFNGVLLWKRDIKNWVNHLHKFRAGPIWLNRKLVSIDDRVYVTLGLTAPVSVLNAASGETLMTYKGSEKAEEIVCHDGVLFVVVGDPALVHKASPLINSYRERFVKDFEPEHAKKIIAYDALSGKVLWEKTGDNFKYLVPTSLSAIGGKVCFMDADHIFCVNLKDGKEIWRAPFKTEGFFLTNYAPTLVLHKDIAVCLGYEKLKAYSMVDGKSVWNKPFGYAGFGGSGDMFIIGNDLWLANAQGYHYSDKQKRDRDELGKKICVDILTGEKKKSIAEKHLPSGHHHRCYRNKATENYLIYGRRGVDFLDVNGEGHKQNVWIRGICQYGIMPCNGMVYVPPDPCACYPNTKFNGLMAFTAQISENTSGTDAPALVKGVAYNDVNQQIKKLSAAEEKVVGQGKEEGGIWTVAESALKKNNDWPTYRHDISRSGFAQTSLSGKLKKLWKSERLGAEITSSVSVGGRLFVASEDKHTLVCLDGKTGKNLWTFTAGGGIDSPPSIYGPLAVFGSRDGHVYAVRVSDGKLAWRFRAAPTDRKIVVESRLESPWPVHGAVLILNKKVYFAAGRHSNVDGGIRLMGLDVATGEVLFDKTMSAEKTDVAGDREHIRSSGMPDIFVSNGEVIGMRNVLFTKELSRFGAEGTILNSITGILGDSRMHRMSWVLGSNKVKSGSYTYDNPFGLMIVFDDKVAVGIQSLYSFRKYTPSLWPENHTGDHHQQYIKYSPRMFPVGIRLYSQKNVIVEDDQELVKKEEEERAKLKGIARSKWRPDYSGTRSHLWTEKVKLIVNSMLLTSDTVYVAGEYDSLRIFESADEMKKGGVMMAFSRKNGEKIAEYPLDSNPVNDGMIAADGKLFVSLENGSVVCWK
ncbi:PQQ-binding-like beta-propeller repeat protein [Verrucomicrobiota bacterium]